MAKAAIHGLDRHIGKRLQKLRDELGVSAVKVAEAIGATQQQISRYENGQNKLSASQLYRLATSLGVPISWFFLDYQPTPDDAMPAKSLVEPPPKYEVGALNDQLEIIRARWPSLTPTERTALLRLLDAFLESANSKK